MLLEEELDAVVATAEEALAMDDAWAGFVHTFERALELSARHRHRRRD